MSTPVLEVRHFSKCFTLHQQGGVIINALDNINFSVFAGECVALCGPSGAGKSTMLKALYGNYLTTCGEVLIRTDTGIIDIGNAAPRTVLRLRRDVISYVSQFLRVIPRVSALDIAAEPLIKTGVDADVAISAATVLFRRLNLPERLWNLAPATFSGGEQQRVNIARSMIRRTPVLLLDEPTASLDANNRKVVVDLIQEAKQQGTAVIGIFHDDAARKSVASRCIHMIRS